MKKPWSATSPSKFPNLARFRVNAFNQHRGAAAVFRTIPSKVLTLEDLNCPKIFKDISEYPRGIVLVPGRPVPASRQRWPPWSTTSTKTTMATF
jgi:twitching motility protein PilT